jgi:diguanylate cyclase (GGDEF)-like protein
VKRTLHRASGTRPAAGSDGGEADPVAENQALRRQLRHLLGEAAHNERSLRRFQSLEIELLGCVSLPALLALLLNEAPVRCDWDRVSLFLHDPDYEIRRLLEQGGCDPADFPDLVFVDGPERLHALHAHRRLPRLGPILPGRHADLFHLGGEPAASVALLPLERGGRLFGSLNLGSLNRDRFPRSAGSDFLHHLAAIVSVCLEMAVSRERLQHLGLTDALTGVNNRRFFDQRLPEEIARAQRTGGALSCLFIDVDHFKRFNDSHGHQAGDEALRAVAGLVRTLLRRSDVLARYGGEEFAAILPQAGRDEALEIAERVRERIAAEPVAIGDGGEVCVTVSIGVATLIAADLPGDPAALGARLVETADRGVYAAKAAGRNRVVSQWEA